MIITKLLSNGSSSPVKCTLIGPHKSEGLPLENNQVAVCNQRPSLVQSQI